MIELKPIIQSINRNAFGAVTTGAGAVMTWPTAQGAWFGQYMIGGYLGAACLYCTAASLRGLTKLRERQRLRRKFEARARERHTGRWATDEELEQAGMFKPNGRPLGMTFSGRAIFEPASVVHSKVLANVGMGKTTACVVPTVMHLALRGKTNIVIMDLKDGEIAAQCADALRRLGFKVRIIDDLLLLKLPRSRANWLEPLIRAVKAGDPEAMAMARDIALTLEPEPSGDAKNRFFRDGPRLIIVYVILTLARKAPEDCTPSAGWQLLADPRLLRASIEQDILNGGALGALAQRVKDLQNGDDDHFPSFLNTARERFAIYEEGGPLYGVGENCDMSLVDIKSEPSITFVVGSQRNVKVMGPHYTLYLRALMQATKVPGGRKVDFICEEFTASPLQTLVEDLAVLRGYGGRAMLVCQAESEIERRFGKEQARTISAVCGLKQFMGISDPEEAERLSKLLGQTVHFADGIGVNDADEKISANLTDHGRSLMSADEILAMPRDEQIILIDGIRPLRAKKLYQNQIAPICDLLDPNPMEGGKLPSDPIITITYEE